MSKLNLFIVILFAISLFLYTFKLEQISSGFHGDEAELSLFSVKIVNHQITTIIGVGQHNHPILSFLPQALSFLIFGISMLAARLPSALFSAFSIPIFYFFIKYLFNRRVAIFSSIFFMFSHLWIAMSRLAINNSQVVFFELIAFYLLFLSLKTKRTIFFALLGISLSMTFYLYAGFRVIPLIILLIVLKEIIFSKTRLNLIFKFFLSALFFLIFSLPQINFYLKYPYTFTSREDSIFIFSKTGEGSQWRKNNYGQLNVPGILFEQAKKTFMLESRDTSGQYGSSILLDHITWVLLLFGIIITLRYAYKTKYLFLLFWFFLTLIIGNLLTIDPFFLPRATGALPALFILVGIAIDVILKLAKKFSNKLFLISYIIICFMSVIMVLFNLKVYFAYSESNMFGDPNKYAATKIAKYLQAQDYSYNVIFLTSPMLHADFAPIRFLSPKTKAVDIENPENYRPIIMAKTIFIIYPIYKNKLDELRIINPNGITIQEKDIKNQIQYFIYKTY